MLPALYSAVSEFPDALLGLQIYLCASYFLCDFQHCVFLGLDGVHYCVFWNTLPPRILWPASLMRRVTSIDLQHAAFIFLFSASHSSSTRSAAVSVCRPSRFVLINRPASFFSWFQNQRHSLTVLQLNSSLASQIFSPADQVHRIFSCFSGDVRWMRM
jgi:hypothetical protein